jgi:hypothetical protein
LGEARAEHPSRKGAELGGKGRKGKKDERIRREIERQKLGGGSHTELRGVVVIIFHGG